MRRVSRWSAPPRRLPVRGAPCSPIAMRSIHLQSSGARSASWQRSPTNGAISPRARSSPTSFTNRLSRSRPQPSSGAAPARCWSGREREPRKLLGFFPARVVERRYGLKLPVLVGWTHPYAPLGTPLVERDAAEPVIAAWLAHLADNPALPGLLLLPLIAEDGPFAAALNATLRRAQMPCCRFCAPPSGAARAARQPRALHRARALAAPAARAAPHRPALADLGALLFTAATGASAIAGAIEDFFVLEASGWKGTAGTAAAYHDEVIAAS